MTIMLVDDDDDDQDIFREALSIVKPDCQLIRAIDGQQALTILDESTELPDYVFLDLNMPKMGGKEFLKNFKSHSKYKSTPVVIYSTSSHKSEVGEYFRLGASNYITKPSEFNLLVTYLKSVLH